MDHENVEADDDIKIVWLRDTFAAAALTGLLVGTNWIERIAAQKAYAYADVMLAERAKKA